ncbi:MAG: hypothetical protein KGO50_16155 [Myxococcales bacterium]|nr:hypothetical protein [Myxococcales bacterium]
MARISNDQRLANIHAEAMQEFDQIQSALRDERLQCLQDRRFYSIAGAQWEGPLGEQFENKPKFEVNKIASAVMRIVNEYRNNRISVSFQSADGDKDDKTAELCDDLFRSDEQDSVADEAYDNAFEEAVGGGFGAFRLRTVYEDEEDPDNERQRIVIEPIFDADSSVYFDLQAKRQDKADAKRCFVLTSMTRNAYKAEWGDDPSSWPKQIHQHEFDWLTPDIVYVAEYYRIEEVRETIRIWQTLDGEEEKYPQSDFDADPGLEEKLIAIGSVEVRQKRIKRKRCHKYLLNAIRVLEDVGYVAGNAIPVVPAYGKRWFIDNVERCMGHVRLAKDAQRLGNMQRSKLGEISALSSIEKPIFTPEQVAGHQVMWSEDNLKNYPYLLANPITDASGNIAVTGPIGYTKPPAVPPALAGLVQLTENDMRDVLGNQEQGDKIVSNISGKAVEMIQQRLDMQAYLYMSNFAKAKRRGGEIWLGMAREIYNEPGRRLKTVGAQAQLGSVELMLPKVNENGEIVMENDLSDAKLFVLADIGPTSQSKRAATVRALTGMLAITSDAETQQVLQAMAMMNMEGEGISEVREFFRKKLVRLGVVKPTDEEAQALMAAMQGQRGDPNAIFLAAAAEEASAKAAKARADVVATVADAELTRAKTVETLSKVDQTQQDQALQVIDRFLPQAPVLPVQPQ